MSLAVHTVALTKSYKNKTAVAPLNLDIADGELFALLGPNGAGKTTTIKMLCCLIAPTSGQAEVCGYNVTTDGIKVKQHIAVSPQETAVARNLTAVENLQMVASICGKSAQSAVEMAEKFHLTDKIAAQKLSGGNQRRLSIAMALLTEPDMLFLDEPTLGLDIEARYELWEMIKQLKGKTTILLTTHYLEEADALADRIGIIKDGVLIELASPEELKRKYAKEGETNPSFDEIYMRIVRGGL